jgi:hypothetical protein
MPGETSVHTKYKEKYNENSESYREHQRENFDADYMTERFAGSGGKSKRFSSLITYSITLSSEPIMPICRIFPMWEDFGSGFCPAIAKRPESMAITGTEAISTAYRDPNDIKQTFH